MQFCCFSPVPWPSLSTRPRAWPFPNDAFDPERGNQIYQQAVDQLVYAESCGFDWVGVGEDHMTAYALTPNPLLILSVVAARTQRVKLAVLGAPLPLLNPIRVAEEMAMLDVLSGGRLIAGFVRGVPQNYAAYNMNPGESRARFAEADDLIRRIWTQRGPFEWSSAHYAFPKVSVWPTPMQQPHPPIVYSANSETSARYGAERRSQIGAIHLYSLDALDRIAASIRAYRDVAEQEGWTPDPDRFVIGLQTCIADSDSEAQDLLGPALDYQFGVLSGTFDKEKRRIASQEPGYGYSPVEERPPTLAQRLEHNMLLCGSPATVAGQIEHLRDRLGIGVISTHFQVGTMPDANVRRGMELFAEKIRPQFPHAAPLGALR